MAEFSRRSFFQQAAILGALSGAARPHAETIMEIQTKADASAFLEAGAAVRDITPEEAAPLWGYSGVERNGDATLDPLMARATVLRVADVSLALVVLDLGRMPMPNQCARIRAQVRDAGIVQVIFMATHTHSAPYMEIAELPHVARTEQLIVEVIQEAASKLQPATIGTGHAMIDIAHNRRLIEDGECTMWWRNAERKPSGPVDKDAGLLRIDSIDGEAIAVLVNYACHPVIFGPDSKQYSADWCGAMCRRIEEDHGGVCLFLQGAAGDINPYMDKTPLADGAVETMRAEGQAAATAVLEALETLDTVAPEAPSLGYIEERIEVGLRYDLDDTTQVDILKAAYGPMFDFYMQPFAENPTVPVSTLLIGGGPALLFQPGEFFVQFQLDVKARSPHPDTFFCGYANEFHIYFPTVYDAAIGGYGASTATYVGLGAGERCVTQGLIQLGRLTEQFRPLRGPEDFVLEEINS